MLFIAMLVTRVAAAVLVAGVLNDDEWMLVAALVAATASTVLLQIGEAMDDGRDSV